MRDRVSSESAGEKIDTYLRPQLRKAYEKAGTSVEADRGNRDPGFTDFDDGIDCYAVQLVDSGIIFQYPQHDFYPSGTVK